MNTLISPETKQLLFDKGWRYELSESYDPEIGGTRVNHSLGEQRWNEGKNLTYVDITTSEVVMWFYEKHGIWIYPLPVDDSMKLWQARIIKGEPFNKLSNTLKIISHGEISYRGIYSPTEAYEAAIEYTLNNLI